MIGFVVLMVNLTAIGGVKPHTPVVIQNNLGRALEVHQLLPDAVTFSIPPNFNHKVADIERPIPLSGKKGKEFTWGGFVVLPNGVRVKLGVLYKGGYLYVSIYDFEAAEKQHLIGNAAHIEEKFRGDYKVVLHVSPNLKDMMGNLGYQTLLFEVSEEYQGYRPY